MHIISCSTTHRISIFLFLLSCVGSNIAYNLNYLIVFIFLSTYYLMIIRILLYTRVHKIIICPLKYITAYSCWIQYFTNHLILTLDTFY